MKQIKVGSGAYAEVQFSAEDGGWWACVFTSIGTMIDSTDVCRSRSQAIEQARNIARERLVAA